MQKEIFQQKYGEMQAQGFRLRQMHVRVGGFISALWVK
jgi:hypothetical protein